MTDSHEQVDPVDPNVAGHGIFINELKRDGTLDRYPEKREAIAKLIDIDLLLNRAYSIIDDNGRLRECGFDDINNLIDSGIFADCPDKLVVLVQKIEFLNRLEIPGSPAYLKNEQNPEIFAETLARAVHDHKILGIVEAVASRKDFVQKSWGKKILIELLKQGFFDGHQDAIDEVCGILHAVKERRKSDGFYTSVNGVAGKIARDIEMPLVRAIIKAGLTVRYKNAVPANALGQAGLSREMSRPHLGAASVLD